MRLGVTFGAIIALALVTGCGGGNPTNPPAGASATPASASIVCGASGSGTAVAIADFAFNPASANTTANGFVTWNNSDGATHTVTFDNGPDCGNVPGGGTTTAQFSVAGSYAYHCKIHSTMHGTIVVA
ncbi:MAG: cupredoxin domain-containing protein [Chloroflexota bacterium]